MLGLTGHGQDFGFYPDWYGTPLEELDLLRGTHFETWVVYHSFSLQILFFKEPSLSGLPKFWHSERRLGARHKPRAHSPSPLTTVSTWVGGGARNSPAVGGTRKEDTGSNQWAAGSAWGGGAECGAGRCRWRDPQYSWAVVHSDSPGPTDPLGAVTPGFRQHWQLSSHPEGASDSRTRQPDAYTPLRQGGPVELSARLPGVRRRARGAARPGSPRGGDLFVVGRIGRLEFPGPTKFSLAEVLFYPSGIPGCCRCEGEGQPAQFPRSRNGPLKWRSPDSNLRRNRSGILV